MTKLVSLNHVYDQVSFVSHFWAWRALQVLSCAVLVKEKTKLQKN